MSKKASESSEEQRALQPVKSGKELLLLLNQAGPPTETDPALLERWRDDEGKDLARMKPEDLVAFPFLRLLQGQSPPVQNGLAKPGCWWDVEREADLGPTIVVVPVFSFMTRVRWAPIEQGESRPLCRSANFRVGAGDPGGDCDECTFRKRWVARGERKPIGDCDESYNFLFWVFGHDQALMSVFSRTASAVGRQLTRLIGSSGRGFRCFTHAYTLSSESKKNQTNQIFHVPKIDLFPNGQRRQSIVRPEFDDLVERLARQADELAMLYDQGRLVPTFEDANEASDGGGEKGGDFEYGANAEVDDLPEKPAKPERAQAEASEFS